MDTPEIRTLHPRDVLRQLADSMNCKHNELSITLPAHTTWRSAIQAVEAALSDVDEDFLLMPRGTGNRRAIREMALQLQAASELRSEQAAVESHPADVLGRPIRTRVDLGKVGPRPPPNEATRERLRKIAKEAAADTGFPDPYVSLRPTLQDKCLPIIRGNLTLRALDGNTSDPICELKGMEMIFDTGAQRTIMAEELLPAAFREYLKDPVHDLHRSNDCLSVQVDVDIALTNCPAVLEAIALIVPRAKMPNQLLGILFGQISCIDRLSLQAIPRRILLAKKENISEEFWGDIVLNEYLDFQDEVVSL
ncbi:uncharacterized protein N7515_003522 [Penicillium bovifimosum]|uniref:Peptidase A2 domain-containing protein n=1 Tax=Penicillium bovifimosum TaxID=126998 RepID=A0A9W9L5T5_9EURO|nr:uncharacterized protein N7515_003522 [Penicillium bovifimosum]KAJ5138674.1 hypothetical protein N7515_003522 [Penicillium bovifimosum]